MKKKSHMLLYPALALSLLLTGCSSTDSRTYTVNSSNVPEKSYALSDTLDDAVSFEVLEVPSPQNAYIGSLCAYESDIYYVAEYIDYVAPQTGESVVEDITQEYYTQIFRYNQENGETSRIYTADGLYQITGLCCNEEQLLWVEQNYESEELWEIKRTLIGDSSMPVDTILKSSQTDGSLLVVMPQVGENSLFFYEFTEYDSSSPTHPIILYRLDLKTGKLEQFKTELDLASPYEDIPCREGRLTFYSYGEALNRIYVDALTDGTDYILETPIDVCSPAANSSYCIWARGYDATLEPFLYLFDFRTEELSYIAMTNSIFAYELIGHFAFVSESDSAIWCLDLEKMEMVPLVTDKNYSYQTLFPQNDNTIYAKLAHSEESFTLLKISVSAQ